MRQVHPGHTFVAKVESVSSSRSLLDILLGIETGGRWPDELERYRYIMSQLASELEGPEPMRGVRLVEMRTLLERELGALLQTRDEQERVARRDAFNEIVSDAEGLSEALDQAASRLTPDKAPNLISFFRAKLIWKANDILESEIRRHARRVKAVPDPHVLRPVEQRIVPGARHTQRRILIQQVMQAFGEADPVNGTILAGLMEGESIAELARRTGRSRQQIYRFLQRVRTWIERRG